MEQWNALNQNYEILNHICYALNWKSAFLLWQGLKYDLKFLPWAGFSVSENGPSAMM